MIAALRQRFSLTAEQRALLKHKLIEGSFTAEDLIARLTPMARIDAVADQGRKTGCAWMVGLFIGLVVTFILVLVNDGASPWFKFILGGLAVLIVAVLLLRMSLSGMDDKENYLREVALPFLSAVQEDVREGKALAVRIDFSAIKQKSKLDRVEKPPLPRGHSLVKTWYRNPWFEGSAPLAIGGKLGWQVTDLLCVIDRTKRGSSGKWKRKTKTKHKARLDVALSLPVSRYMAAEAADPSVVVDGKWIVVSLSHRVLPSAEPGTTVRGVRIGASGEPASVVDELIGLVALAFNKVKPINDSSRGAP